MARLLPFYRTGGLLSGASGGGISPLGDATVWPAVANWAALGTIAGPLRAGDFAPVTSLGFAGSTGLARYDGAVWQLAQGLFATVANLMAFAQPIASNALVIVGTGVETDPVYFYDGASWLRTPDGVHYIWQQAANWAALASIPAAQNSDRVALQTLGTAHSSGYAERHGGAWKLVQGRFASVADMTGWSSTPGQVVHPGAFAEVKAGGSHDDDSVTYVYQSGAWVRFAGLTAGYAWDITDLTNIDPSGVGATQIGDFARYTNPTTSAVEVYRLRAVTLGATAGSGSITMWVPASIYGEAGLTIRGYLVGTETMPASGSSIQGYLVTASGASASVTTSSGEVVLASTTGGHFANIKSTYVLQENDRVYVRLNLRISQTAGVNSSFYNALYDNGTTKSQFITSQNPTAPAGNTNKYLPTTGGIVLVGSTAMVRNAGTPIVNTAELVEILADGTVQAGSPANPNFMVNVSRNARPYFSMRRAAQTGTETGQHLLQVLNGATGAQSARFSYLYFMTY